MTRKCAIQEIKQVNVMNNRERTRKLLILHAQTYPQLQIQDLFKYLHQSAFGCEHLVSARDAAADYISREYDQIDRNAQPLTERLDGGYSRVHLSCLNTGLRAGTLAALFSLSAQREENEVSDLAQKLEVAKELVLENLLPFSKDEFGSAVRAWEQNGYPPLHHSDSFRSAYKPAYRVISNRYLPFLPLFAGLDKRLESGRVILAIEGGSASGKTTLSGLLAEVYNCTVFHMDDFFLRPEQRTPERYAQPGGNVDRERFLAEVLLPLSRSEPVTYRKFDCSTMRLGETIQVTPQRLTVVEGAYSMHPDLAGYYDFSVFLDVSPALQTKRITGRNSPELAKRFFAEWIPLEKTYFSSLEIPAHCDMRLPVTPE